MSEFGDQEFEQFMEDGKPKTAPFFLTLTVREKAKTLGELLKAANELYVSSSENAKHREKIEEYIHKLLQASLETLNQFDYIAMDQLDGDGGEESGNDKETRKN